ncbi:hypothetical protein FHG66_08305 [Rubellimicrobium rubrum]|uniref:Uncharacterized protein n=1 Tax=Rubellimicrobium rubrum TaxID=2585369 RepID=A0A5C4MZK7_9RHOB|nr:hypothetical protein [Rubellimicrobium rubrum]TNC50485.1 hypothetical protein FHG66_08305 [Rubellimicrobium rubrum]
MTMTELLSTQLTDPFRLGLIVALVVTMLRTEAVTGRWLPLAAGVLFVAFIIPATMGQGAATPFWQLVAAGVIANVLLLAVVMAIRHVVLRIMP